jgi:hypothetical protein
MLARRGEQLRGLGMSRATRLTPMLTMMATARSWLRAGSVCYCQRLQRRGRRSLVPKDAFVDRAI